MVDIKDKFIKSMRKDTLYVQRSRKSPMHMTGRRQMTAMILNTIQNHMLSTSQSHRPHTPIATLHSLKPHQTSSQQSLLTDTAIKAVVSTESCCRHAYSRPEYSVTIMTWKL